MEKVGIGTDRYCGEGKTPTKHQGEPNHSSTVLITAAEPISTNPLILRQQLLPQIFHTPNIAEYSILPYHSKDGGKKNFLRFDNGTRKTTLLLLHTATNKVCRVLHRF